MIEILFIGSLFLIFYTYMGYPMSLWVFGIFRKKEIYKTNIFPDVTMIITAFNEEKRIKNKIENTLKIIYPKDKIQIIVASDGSNDLTNDIVNDYKNSNIQLLSLPIRNGKENAQKEAIKIARGELIVFTDVATIIEPMGLKNIVSNFADPSVGCVSSEDRFIGRDGVPSGEGVYVRYEMMLRRLESRVNSLVGLSGSFFAARKSVCMDFQGDMQSDFRTLLNCVKMGLRGISDPETTGTYMDVTANVREFDRKVRTVLRGLTVYFRHLEFLNVFQYGLFSYQYFCHKLLRWLVPIFLFFALIFNMFLSIKSNTYFMIFIWQLLFYGIALLGLKSSRLASIKIIKIPYYFLTVNISILMAWWRFICGQRVVMWTPSDR